MSEQISMPGVARLRALSRATIIAGAVAVLLEGFLTVRLVGLIRSHPNILSGPSAHHFVARAVLPFGAVILAIVLICAGAALLRRSAAARVAIMIAGPLVAAVSLIQAGTSLPVLVRSMPSFAAAVRSDPRFMLTVVWLVLANGMLLLTAVTLIIVFVGLLSAEVREAMLPPKQASDGE